MADDTQNPKDKENPEQESLDNFNWEEGEATFFGLGDDNKPIPDKKVETPPAKVKDKDPEEEEEEEEDPVFFNQNTSEEEGRDPEEEDEGDELDQDEVFKTFTDLKENGLFQNIELPEGKTSLTKEELAELYLEDKEAYADEALEELMTGLPEDGVAFLKFVKDGGDIKTFFNILGQSLEAPTGDIKDPVYQEKVARYYYQNVEQVDAEDIDDKIEWLKDGGKLAKYAEKFNTKVQTLKAERLKAEKDSLTLANKQREETAKAFASKVHETLEKTDAIENFVFDKKRKAVLNSFITKPSVKEGNTLLTPMQVKLKAALKDPQKLLMLADLLERDFDTTAIAEQGATKLTKKIKENVTRTAPLATNSGGSRTQKRSVTDYFN